MKEIIFSLILSLIITSSAYSMDWYDKTNASVCPVKENKVMDMLNRADKWRTSPEWRYYPHISHRYYYDCSYYRYVNCEDMRYGRCWQCRDYIYKYEYAD